MKRVSILCLIAAFAAGGGVPVKAAPISFTTDATATLTITGISPTPLPVNVFIVNAPLPSVSPPIEEVVGNATVMTDGSANGIGDPEALGIGDGFFNATSAAGMADAPPFSSAFAFSLAGGQILVDNETNDTTVTVDFLLSYTLAASATTFDAATEDVFAFSDVQLNWEPVSGTFDFFVDTAGSDDRFGDPTMVDEGFAFSVTVAPGQVGNASLQTASSGFADVIPVPAAFWLFGSALGLLGWIRRWGPRRS